MNVEYKITDANQYIVKSEEQKIKDKEPKRKKIIFSVYNSYEIRNNLRGLGMHYVSDKKVWQIKINLGTDDTIRETQIISDGLHKLNVPLTNFKKDIKIIKKPCCLISYE